MSLNTFSSCFVQYSLNSYMWLKITTGQTLDSKFVPNSLNVRTTAGETGMLSGHWFLSHITSLAGYINYIVNVRHSYAVVSKLKVPFHY